MNENLGSFGKEDRGLGADHLHVVVELHDLLDSRQGELLVLEATVTQLADLFGGFWPEILVSLLGLKQVRKNSIKI